MPILQHPIQFTQPGERVEISDPSQALDDLERRSLWLASNIHSCCSTGLDQRVHRRRPESSTPFLP